MLIKKSYDLLRKHFPVIWRQLSKIFVLFQVLNDLVQGEFMQLGAKETENERFSHYFTKTYRKTASLIANSLKAVSS